MGNTLIITGERFHRKKTRQVAKKKNSSKGLTGPRRRGLLKLEEIGRCSYTQGGPLWRNMWSSETEGFAGEQNWGPTRAGPGSANRTFHEDKNATIPSGEKNFE